MKIIYFYILFILALVIPIQFTFADKCSDTTTCTLENIPLLNQNNPNLGTTWFQDSSGNYYNSDKSTNLCGPTSIAALMSGVLKNSKTISLKSSSWIYSFYQATDINKITLSANQTAAYSRYSRTIDQIKKEGTYPEELLDAIYNSMIGGAAAGNVLPSAPFYYYSGFGITYKSFCSFQNNIKGISPYNGTDLKNRMGMILQIGHYFGTDSTYNGVKLTTYKRDGGHFIVIYGYTENRLNILEVSGPVGSTEGLATNERLSRLYGTVKDDNGTIVGYNGVYYAAGDTAMQKISDTVKANSVGYLWDRRDPATGYIPIIESIIYLGTIGD